MLEEQQLIENKFREKNIKMAETQREQDNKKFCVESVKSFAKDVDELIKDATTLYNFIK